MGKYSHTNPTNRMRARKLLAALMPEARKQAETFSDLVYQTGTAAGRAVSGHVREDNLAGVHVYPADKGGWHADIVLQRVPLGIPDVLCTPVALPCRTREEAVAAAVGMLAGIVGKPRHEHVGPEVDEGMVPFQFDEVVLQVPRAVMEEVVRQVGPPEPGYAAGRLEEILLELPGEGRLTAARAEALSREHLAALLSVACLALLSGIHRWPPNQPMPPAPSNVPN